MAHNHVIEGLGVDFSNCHRSFLWGLAFELNGLISKVPVLPCPCGTASWSAKTWQSCLGTNEGLGSGFCLSFKHPLLGTSDLVDYYVGLEGDTWKHQAGLIWTLLAGYLGQGMSLAPSRSSSKFKGFPWLVVLRQKFRVCKDFRVLTCKKQDLLSFPPKALWLSAGVMAFTVEPDNHDSFIDFNVQAVVSGWRPFGVRRELVELLELVDLGGAFFFSNSSSERRQTQLTEQIFWKWI